MTNLLIGTVVEWSRLQFALTAMFHWIFVPLTLGLSFMIAIMETIYVKTGNEFWKKTVKFWMTIFGINFAIGVATGIILEFEFGLNWSNYSWFVGDIFGAPLAIEGILAFFMESTFIAIMFFGWNKVSKKTHLIASWLTAFGASLSALWILVANGWMQYPVGMSFNPDTARNEMNNFWEVLFSPVAINKFLHAVTSGYVLAAVVVIGISSWFLIKGRETLFAKKSILIAGTFGLISWIALLFTGHTSAGDIAKVQPMKLAAMEGLYIGGKGAGLSIIGIPTLGKKYNDNKKDYIFNIKVPYMLSILGYNSPDAFVPGIKDIIEGGYEKIDLNGEKSIAISVEEKIAKGRVAINALDGYKKAKKEGNEPLALSELEKLEDNFAYYGYGYLDKPEDTIPNVYINYFSFRIMVGLGFLFLLLFIVALYGTLKNKFIDKKWVLWIFVLCIPLAYLCSQTGWIVAELGRQPWTIQDMLPTVAAVSRIETSAVMLTFFLFFVLFTILLIAELKILLTFIKRGPFINETKTK